MGSVYIITNPAFGGWIKLGMASNMTKRFKDYFTYAPIPYSLDYEEVVEDANMVESLAHKVLEGYGRSVDGGTEWFQCSVDDGIEAIEKAKKRYHVIQKYINGKDDEVSTPSTAGVLERIEEALNRLSEHST